MLMQFKNLEDAQGWMRRQGADALAAATPAQMAIGYGDWWVRYLPEMPLWIFGHIYTLDELDEQERKLGAPEDEIAASRASVADAHERGYRFGIAHSAWEPDGELGSTHIIAMGCALTEKQFDRCRAAGWSMPALLRGPQDAYGHDPNYHPPDWLLDVVGACAMQARSGWR